MAITQADLKWVEEIIDKLGGLYNKTGTINDIMTFDDVMRILSYISTTLMQEGSLIEVDVPIKVVGDIHGQYQDMHKLFDLIGRVPDVKMLFLGDYVDRGTQSLETVLYLFAMKLRYKDRIFLLRGNHETPAVNRIYGFYAECAIRYGPGLWWEFISVFNRLPLAGLIAKRILCMHGGLSPELTSIDLIRRIKRPCEPVDRGLLIDLLWSDPTSQGDGWFYSPRGLSYAFGKGIMAAACKMLNIDLVIRAHQVVQDGYELMVGRQLITIFSAPNYAGQFNNAAAVVCIDEDLQVRLYFFSKSNVAGGLHFVFQKILELPIDQLANEHLIEVFYFQITFQQLRVPCPNTKCSRPCPAVACEPGKALELPEKLTKQTSTAPSPTVAANNVANKESSKENEKKEEEKKEEENKESTSNAKKEENIEDKKESKPDDKKEEKPIEKSAEEKTLSKVTETNTADKAVEQKEEPPKEEVRAEHCYILE
uniref:Serine/threonine-protein phosphatase n=1 Tax=Ascaris lumbricoides TaxID=6252 RepID=A0A0M3I617_ASCLU